MAKKTRRKYQTGHIVGQSLSYGTVGPDKKMYQVGFSNRPGGNCVWRATYQSFETAKKSETVARDFEKR